tara:strand:- start:1100 stop:1888 length:789 start_codon:yes stop_codon:yes gene_type:complete
MPDISKIGTVATADISKVGTVTYDSDTISNVLGVDVPDSGGGGDDGGGGGGSTASAGYYPTTWDASNSLFTSDGGTSLKTYDVDFSSSDYANGSIVGETVEIYFMYTTQIHYQGWRGDPQLYRYDLTGTDGSNLLKPNQYYSNWRQASNNPRSVSSDRYRYQMDSGSYKVSGLTFSLNFQTSTSQYGKWVRKSSGGTGSSGTGVSATGYVYYEASSSGYASNQIKASFIRHNSFTATSDSMRFQWYNYGAQIGALNVGIRVL